MVKVKVKVVPVEEQYEFNDKEWVIVQHWYESGNVILLLAEPMSDEEMPEEAESMLGDIVKYKQDTK